MGTALKVNHAFGTTVPGASTTAIRDDAGLIVAAATITESTGAGTYTAAFALPAGAVVVNVIVHAQALWAASTSATLKVGDATDDDGIFTAVNLKATDLLAGESIDFYAAGGKQGADLDDAAAPGAQVRRRRITAARTISAVVTTVGAAGATGITHIEVIYTQPTFVAAVKA